jgi:hypothetical protein
MRGLHFAGILRDDQSSMLMRRNGDELLIDVKEKTSCLLCHEPLDQFLVNEFFDFSLEPSATRTPKVRQGLTVI